MNKTFRITLPAPVTQVGPCEIEIVLPTAEAPPLFTRDAMQFISNELSPSECDLFIHQAYCELDRLILWKSVRVDSRPAPLK